MFITLTMCIPVTPMHSLSVAVCTQAEPTSILTPHVVCPIVPNGFLSRRRAPQRQEEVTCCSSCRIRSDMTKHGICNPHWCHCRKNRAYTHQRVIQESTTLYGSLCTHAQPHTSAARIATSVNDTPCPGTDHAATLDDRNELFIVSTDYHPLARNSMEVHRCLATPG